MSHVLRSEYGFALLVTVVLHALLLFVLEPAKKGNAPRDGYQLAFSVGAYGGAEQVSPIAKPTAAHETAVTDGQKPVDRPQNLVEEKPPESKPEPEPEPEQGKKERSPLSAPPRDEAPDLVVKKIDPIPDQVEKIEPESVAVAQRLAPNPLPKPERETQKSVDPVKSKLVAVPVKKPVKEPEPARTVVRKPEETGKPVPAKKTAGEKTEQPVSLSAEETESAAVTTHVATVVPSGAKAVGKEQDTGGGGSNPNVTSGVSGGIKGVRVDYMTLVQHYLARHKKYPKRARLRRQQGTSVVEFTISPSGRITSAALRESSGYKILDKAVLELLKRASPLPRPPAALQQKSMKVVLPIAYTLRTG